MARPDGRNFTADSRIKKSPVRAEGFYTEDIFENRKRVGYLTKTLQGESLILAKSGLPSELCVDRFGVDLQTVETLVVPAIETALRSADLLIMGQIGKMEIASPRFPTPLPVQESG